ncbi:MAG: heavy-metal-associated domain-containing protein [Prolixibacteraceae bacterium]
MKTKILSLVALFLMATASVFAAEKTEKVEIKGNCGMCEKRIEKAALSVDGVTKADWNKETKMMELVLDDTKTNLDKVEMAIAKVGHDTPNHKAKEAVYDELPGCCQYDRTSEKSSDKKEMKKMDGSMKHK